MPRLFTSTRPPPVNITTMHPLLATALPLALAPSSGLQAKRKLPELADDEPDLELIDEQASYHELHPFAGSSAQPSVQSLQQNELNQAGVVKVPSVTKNLARLMDSHDLDNPYLVAAFNVLVDNDNNPMRVPDILQAVQKQGWTQVLHRHKDRPEQLFGNALRAHQRRREFMNKPSLVFMVDAGGCWKHHELDLSAASGRRKGKIWCLSLESGYPCPYARLGLDLNWVIKAQHGPGGPQAAKPTSDADEPSAKRRKVDVPEPARFVPPAKLVPSRPQQPKSALESATLKSPQILLQPPKVYHPSSVLTQTVPRVAVTHATATAVPPSTAPTSKSASYGIRTAARSQAETTPVLSLLGASCLKSRKNTSTPKVVSPVPKVTVPVVVEYQPMDEDSLPGYHSESDEDDDDFHVTMKDFTATTSFGLSLIQNDHDQDFDYAASSDESIARTPSPPPASATLLTLNCNYDSHEMLLLGGQNAAQDVMMDDPAWSWLTQAGEKNLDLLAAAKTSEIGPFEDEFPPFEEFLDRRKMAITMASAAATTNDIPVVKVEDLEVEISSPYTAFDFDAASLFESHHSGTSTRSSSSWIGRITRESSVCSTTGSICSAATGSSLSVPSLSLSSSFTSQPMSTLQSSTTTTVPLFIATHSLTDDSLIVAEARSFPLKNGLAHQYVTVATPSTDEVSEFFGSSTVDSGAVNEEIKELEEELVDWDAMAADDSEPLSVEPPQLSTQPMEVMSSLAETLTVSTVGSTMSSPGQSSPHAQLGYPMVAL